MLEGIDPEDWQKIRQVVVEVHDLDGRLERMQQLLAEQGFVVEVEQEVGLIGTNIYSLYARRIEAEEEAAAMSEVRKSVVLGAEAVEVSEAELRRYLRERLPEYMVPQVLVKLERMPLSPNGKIDYQKLPPPEEIGSMTRANYVTPRNETERVIAAVWRRVLKVEHVSIADNFFDLGGHSMTLIQLRQLIQEALGRDIPLVEMFRHPTVAALADYINGETELDSMEEAKQRGLKRVAALQRQRA